MIYVRKIMFFQLFHVFSQIKKWILSIISYYSRDWTIISTEILYQWHQSSCNKIFIFEWVIRPGSLDCRKTIKATVPYYYVFPTGFGLYYYCIKLGLGLLVPMQIHNSCTVKQQSRAGLLLYHEIYPKWVPM